MTKITRRSALQLAAGASALPLLATPTILLAQEKEWRHGLSNFDELKYSQGFKRFDYVNRDAPKGGTVRLSGIGSFDNLNIFTFKGSTAAISGLTFDPLFTTPLDEPNTAYGLVASQAWYPEDFSSVTFRLDPRARFHDGSPITPQDVIWSMQAQRGAHPQSSAYYKNIKSAEQNADNEVTFQFDLKGNRELPTIVAQLLVLPKHWWAAKNTKGEERDVKKTTLEPLLGSGAYKIKELSAGNWITLERVEDYWAKDHPTKIGQNNFRFIKQIYFRDQSVALEAFKADQYDWRAENNSKVWATEYNFAAVKQGRILVETIDQKNGTGMQGFIFNLRRKKFMDARVRRAFNYAFDFEWSNKNLFFGQYTRTNSFFSNSELASFGLPDADELKILEPFRGKIPDEVFTSSFTNPVSGNPSEIRQNLRKATVLFREAGWKTGKDRVLSNAEGDRMEFEILLVSPAFERIVLPYVKQLKLLGVRVKVRTVDAAQYIRRLESFDYDCIVSSWPQSLSPGNEQREFWGSRASGRNGSRNYSGIKNPVIDQIIEKLVLATDRKDQIAATKALDRVLLWNHYIVPMWHINYERTARWNRFGRPEKLPDFSTGFPTIWWWDDEKAAQTKAAK